MKISEMSMEHLAQWCHVLPDDQRLPVAWAAAKNAVLSITGLSEEEADERADLVFPAVAFASDMIYNPGMHVDNNQVNRVAESFLGLHDHNLLPGQSVAGS